MGAGWLVIGVGNRFRTDDAAGIVAAERIGLRAAAPVRLIEGDAADLLEALAGAERAVLIDAVRSESPPGTVHRFDAHAGPLPAELFRMSTHSISAAEVLELARVLGQLPARVVVYGIEAEKVEAGCGLSPGVEEAVRKVCDLAVQDLEATGNSGDAAYEEERADA
jgi:hydrogenase maturation protease